MDGSFITRSVVVHVLFGYLCSTKSTLSMSCNVKSTIKNIILCSHQRLDCLLDLSFHLSNISNLHWVTNLILIKFLNHVLKCSLVKELNLKF